jgi:hypothetical protein
VKVEAIEIHAGEPTFEYTPVRALEAKCEAMTNFSKAPTMEDVNAKLRQMASGLGADAVVRVEYKSGVSLTSWRSMKATGLAVKRVSDERQCPACAETIKRAATKCRFCGTELPQVAAAPAQRTPQPRPTPARPHVAPEPLKSNDNPVIWVVAVIVVLFIVMVLATT